QIHNENSPCLGQVRLGRQSKPPGAREKIGSSEKASLSVTCRKLMFTITLILPKPQNSQIFQAIRSFFVTRRKCACFFNDAFTTSNDWVTDGAVSHVGRAVSSPQRSA